jgi:nicotinate-nucleotide adenylyltransferase
MNSRRICVFGGTFDPIHKAHLRIAEEAAQRFDLDKVLFVPAGNPPHKESANVTSYEDRFRMVELACAPYPKFQASRLEEGTAPSYTIETLERLRAYIGPDDRLFFLIGADAFDELETWRRWKDVVALTEFIVVSRPGRDYHIPENAQVHRLEGLELPVSSSTIRLRLAAGESTPEVPAEVRAFIEKRGLYRHGKQQITASQ